MRYQTRIQKYKDEIEELRRSIDGGGKAEGKALPEPFEPERGREDTGRHKVPR